MSDQAGKLADALADRYRLGQMLGAGGMATVYLAQDLKHDRKVAIKVLRAELAAVIGADRFLAEIKTTANLQHPHILPLHDSGEADSFLYYVMPYVQGESLRDRLNREKQLPIADAVRIASEVASALDYAHRHGVIHRDIKPENILLHDGSALVADFGIALAASKASDSRMTETGMSLGTPHYMSPEQAMGEREIGPQSDVYALGAVTYEMLVGEPPFTGPTAQSIVAKVVTEEPRPLMPKRHTIPPHVEAAVLTALEKLPADRYHTAAQFAEALTHPERVPSRSGMAAFALTGSRKPRRGFQPRQAALLSGALVLGAVIGALMWSATRPSSAPKVRPLVRFTIRLPGQAQPGGALGSTIAFSPDGSRLVYVGGAVTSQQLYLRGLDQPDPVPIPGSDSASLPFFSPDGQWIGFKKGTRLARASLSGGSVVTIGEVPGPTYGATWTADDSIIFASDSGLMTIAAAGGHPHLMARPDTAEAFLWPQAIPGSDVVLFTIRSDSLIRLAALSRRSGEIRRLQQEGGYPHYVDGGYVVLRDQRGSLSAVRFDIEKLRVTSDPVLLAEGFDPDSLGDSNFGVSPSGDIAYQVGGFRQKARMVRVDRNGASLGVLSDTADYYAPRLAPGGRRAVLVRWVSSTSTSRDLWLLDLRQRTRTRLTFDTTASRALWTPDGSRVAYFSDRDSLPGIYWLPVDGSGLPEPLTVGPGYRTPRSFGVQETLLIYTLRPTLQGKFGIWELPLRGSATPRAILVNDFNNTMPSLSPDGRWLVYMSDESGQYEIYVRPYPGPGGTSQISIGGGGEPMWSPSGSEIFYRANQTMMAVEVRTRGSFEVLGRRKLFTENYNTDWAAPAYDLTPDGTSFLMMETVQEERTIVVTLNWFDQRRHGAN